MRPTQTWIVFGLCLALVLAAMALVSYTAVKLDREGREHATREQNVRLALWRMESALSPLIAQESARPYFWYRPFYVAERAYTRMYNEIRQGEVLVPSPLLTQLPTHILLHFQVGPEGEFTSPQAPGGNERDLAESSYTTHESVEASATRLAELTSFVSREQLLTALGEEARQPPVVADYRLVEGREAALRNPDEQYVRNTQEWQARASQQIAFADASNVAFPFSNVKENTMKAVWLETALILARQVRVNGREYLQGCWLDWPGIRDWLLSGVKDLLPAADLKAAGSSPADQEVRVLAAFPIRLVPGPASPNPVGEPSSFGLWFFVAWGGVVVAAVAVAVLLRGAVSLSERRGAFVSAVTHELRTPLTTLQMYTEMLADGIVSDKEKTQRYLETLRVEADRLGHLVENVLAYARLEARRDGGRRETVTLKDLLQRAKDRLAQRARQAGMELTVEDPNDGLSMEVLADTSAVEQILFNLVDNASKYAASASDRTIHIEAGRQEELAVLRVRDHGGGIPEKDARRLFKPFCKSAREAAASAPGVGLGLALSRRLARRMGGELRLDNSVQNGACFILTLPAAHSPDS